ncbi:MAG TPA: heme-binding protein [Allosphingosinicella sp.]|nr:heme-binding protein [Allosphingosinicella sp.]
MPGTHEVRLHNDEIDFGDLSNLAGHWQGANGFNMIAVPNQKGGFELLVAPYTETLIITKVPATTPNRGMEVIENIPTLQYSTTITVLGTGSLMHVEGGFWELSDPTLNDGFNIFRIASVPHGNAVEAMGNSSKMAGRPNIDSTLSGLPTGDIPPGQAAGYMDEYIGHQVYPNFSPVTPNDTLIQYLDGQILQGFKVVATTQLQVSTLNRGGIANIASLQGKVTPSQFDATFWIEILRDQNGNVYRQLQYSQRTLIEFPVSQDKPGQTIVWPHINVNTLTAVT